VLVAVGTPCCCAAGVVWPVACCCVLAGRWEEVL
jgi:hypothetical protein